MRSLLVQTRAIGHVHPVTGTFSLQPGHDPIPSAVAGSVRHGSLLVHSLAGTAIASPLVRQAARTFHGKAGVGHAPAAASPRSKARTRHDRAHRRVAEALYG